MNCLVTYSSRYGSTRQYAQWIEEALSCDLLPASEAGPSVLARYDVLIHGGGLYAGGLSGIRNVTRNFDKLAGKAIIVFSCGLADPKDPENAAHIEAGIAKALTEEMQKKIRQFHFRGGIDYQKLGPVHKAMMAMLRRTMLQKGYDSLRDEDRLMLDTYGQAVDFSDRDSIAPLVEYVRQLSL